MDRRCFLVVAALVASFATGCSSKSTTVEGGQQWVENVPTPDAVVREFLEAVRKGEDGVAELLLTETARAETRKHDLSFAPPGSDTAKFEVGKVEYIAANEVAHVDSVWTDIGEEGQPEANPIIWMLRRDPTGWRVAGMAMKVFKDELPLLLDFENPEDMIRKGEDGVAELLLTDTARAETRKHDLSFAPPGSDTAKFEVGKVEYIAANEVAHVESVRTDIGEDGQPEGNPIIWMLRRDPNGWRVAGMAMKVFKDELPLLLDFENPEDMIRKQQMAEAEMQRRAAGGAPNTAATAPGATGPAAPGAAKQGAPVQQNAAQQNAATAPKGAPATPGARAPGAPTTGQVPPAATPGNPLNNAQPVNAEKPGQRNVLRQ